MISEPIALLDTCDIAGRARAKGFPVTDLSAKLKSRVGWMPTNTMISALGPIADTAFGATGDMVLVPNPASEPKADFEDGSLDQLLLCGLPPAALAMAKALAHWLVTGLPLLLAAAPLAV